MNNANFAYTNSIEIAAAMVALGFKFRTNEPVTRIIRSDGKTSDTFYLQEHAESDDFGLLSAMEVMKAWRQSTDELSKKNPRAAAVIDYMRSASENRKAMIAAVKANVQPRVAHEVNGRVLFIPICATQSTIDAAMKMARDTE